jgi:hypothetical protein
MLEDLGHPGNKKMQREFDSNSNKYFYPRVSERVSEILRQNSQIKKI